MLNPILRGWCGYFNQGPVTRMYGWLQLHRGRLRRWLMRRIQQRGTGSLPISGPLPV